jgi:hypothetical protein
MMIRNEFSILLLSLFPVAIAKVYTDTLADELFRPLEGLFRLKHRVG